ncbi:glycosyltransferase family protein [Hyphomicrobium sp.]|uniref:glycosyltransferase family protein n=1 Tax=Hyphomicrobium sp. TaxID=82 RepID=UPI0025BEFD61|nr:glycosyltransferase family protein [Hyphomicrobium sp.]MCC7250949.1 glycosyltransferase family protein [Hyphomicrobium sp.]
MVASIEARMGSSRLPGKVLMDISGVPALSRLLERLRAVPNVDDIVLATSTYFGDDVLCDWANSEGVRVWRGSEDDVLQRVVEAHRSTETDIVVEITGDCPLICPEVIELAVETYHANRADVVANVVQPSSYPQGTDVQVYAFSLLEDVERRIDDPAVREHVSLYFYENPEIYRLLNLVAPASCRMPRQRLQLDYPEDLECIRRIYEHLLPKHGSVFGLEAITRLLRDHPEIAALNAGCEEKAPR